MPNVAMNEVDFITPVEMDGVDITPNVAKGEVDFVTPVEMDGLEFSAFSNLTKCNMTKWKQTQIPNEACHNSRGKCISECISQGVSPAWAEFLNRRQLLLSVWTSSD